jgi:hypothetical protein
MFFPLGSIVDDAGAIVAGATVTIASVKDPATDNNIASHGATVAVSSDGLRCGVLYDPTTKGDAWVTLAVSKAGSTFSGSNASPVLFAAADAQTIASRASQASVDAVDDLLDTEVAAIKAKTDNLPPDPADASVIAARFDALDTALTNLPTLSEIEEIVPGVVTRSGPSIVTALDTGIDGTVGLFVGDRHSLTVRALIGTEPPGGTGAVWNANTTDEATGAEITTNAELTEISEELGYFAYSLAANDTVSARRVRLTLKRVLGSDVRIFGPLVLNVRDR